ncbi:hypothetical protein [Devosia sp. FJ2-5-3]|jgi:hypothetical protein|uniref:hypothetical protein n=1 Tax=Devosia sp. FJ2-5-3 TaxID=2976680 RepID=UPI0023D89465|nr:hypothetical protein [Devosia sp. FJ2-5-3]WEJ58321.1 hypothetical protein N0P34_19455 [Devosia sp. FJ2-5-3]
METASTISTRRAVIAAAITAELQRQAESSALRIDIEALANAVDLALVPGAPFAEGRKPEQLNATNDD